MQLLLFFNSTMRMKVGEYLEQTKYELDGLRRSILCLIKASILLPSFEVDEASKITPNLELTLNMEYSPNS